MAAIEFGLMLRQNNPGQRLHEVIDFNRRCIEKGAAGFSTLWLEDHLQVGTTDALECLTTLSYLAGQYPQFKIGSLVLSQSYRNPALLAKMAANLHALTGGRLILGLGAGWKEDEYEAYNYSFPPVKMRMEELEEAIQIVRALWTTQSATFAGQHYQVHNATSAPLPDPPIPLLIGGGGERRTLAIVARYADWWNFNSCTVEEYAQKLSVLQKHCDEVGRNPAEISLSYLSTLSVSDDPTQVTRHPSKHFIAGSASEVIQELERFREIGVTHFMFRILDVAALEHFVAHVAPHFNAS